MKLKSRLYSVALCAAFLTALAPSLFAQLNIPSDGSDGALIIASNTVIDLSQAVGGVWSNVVTLANRGKGIYDSNKWAVVFKYSSVTISNGATVTFANHASRTGGQSLAKLTLKIRRQFHFLLQIPITVANPNHVHCLSKLFCARRNFDSCACVRLRCG